MKRRDLSPGTAHQRALLTAAAEDGELDEVYLNTSVGSGSRHYYLGNEWKKGGRGKGQDQPEHERDLNECRVVSVRNNLICGAQCNATAPIRRGVIKSRPLKCCTVFDLAFPHVGQ